MNAMSRDQVRAKVVDTLSGIAPETDIAAIVSDRPLRAQIDLDSFDFLNVIVCLSERFKLKIPETDYAELSTLDAIVDYLAKKSDEKN